MEFLVILKYCSLTLAGVGAAASALAKFLDEQEKTRSSIAAINRPAILDALGNPVSTVELRSKRPLYFAMASAVIALVALIVGLGLEFASQRKASLAANEAATRAEAESRQTASLVSGMRRILTKFERATAVAHTDIAISDPYFSEYRRMLEQHLKTLKVSPLASSRPSRDGVAASTVKADSRGGWTVDHAEIFPESSFFPFDESVPRALSDYVREFDIIIAVFAAGRTDIEAALRHFNYTGEGLQPDVIWRVSASRKSSAIYSREPASLYLTSYLSGNSPMKTLYRSGDVLSLDDLTGATVVVFNRATLSEVISPFRIPPLKPPGVPPLPPLPTTAAASSLPSAGSIVLFGGTTGRPLTQDYVDAKHSLALATRIWSVELSINGFNIALPEHMSQWDPILMDGQPVAYKCTLPLTIKELFDTPQFDLDVLWGPK